MLVYYTYILCCARKCQSVHSSRTTQYLRHPSTLKAVIWCVATYDQTLFSQKISVQSEQWFLRYWDRTSKEFNPRNEPSEPSAPTLGTHPQHLQHLPLDPQYYPQYVVIWYLWTFEGLIINLEWVLLV